MSQSNDRLLQMALQAVQSNDQVSQGVIQAVIAAFFRNSVFATDASEQMGSALSIPEMEVTRHE